MNQINMDEVLQDLENQANSKRLVPKDYMHTIEHKVKNELTENHKTKDEAISATDLAEMFNITTRNLREVIKTIRSKQYTKIIGDSNGYYVGTEQEFEEWYRARVKRTMTSMKTTLDLNPDKIKLLYWLLKSHDKKGVLKGQTQLQFNGHEREIIRQFAEDYGIEIEETQ